MCYMQERWNSTSLPLLTPLSDCCCGLANTVCAPAHYKWFRGKKTKILMWVALDSTKSRIFSPLVYNSIRSGDLGGTYRYIEVQKTHSGCANERKCKGFLLLQNHFGANVRRIFFCRRHGVIGTKTQSWASWFLLSKTPGRSQIFGSIGSKIHEGVGPQDSFHPCLHG